MSQGHAYGVVCSVCTCCELVGASCLRYRFPLYAALYVWNMILKLLHVLGSCSCKMTPSGSLFGVVHIVCSFHFPVRCPGSSFSLCYLIKLIFARNVRRPTHYVNTANYTYFQRCQFCLKYDFSGTQKKNTKPKFHKY